MFNNSRQDQQNDLQDVNTAERLDPALQDIYYYRSSVYMNFGQYDRVRPDLEKLLGSNPYEPVMWLNLGVLVRKKTVRSIAECI